MAYFLTTTLAPEPPVCGLVGSPFYALNWGIGLPLADEAIKSAPAEVALEDVPTSEPQDFFLQTSGCWIVSERIRLSVERFEPITHQFIPVRVRAKGRLREKISSTQYYFMNICRQMQAIDVSRSDLECSVGSNVWRPRGINAKIYVHKEMVDNIHFWVGQNPAAIFTAFISRDVHDTWLRMGAGPIGYRECIEV